MTARLARLTHPRTGLPLAPVGYRKSGAPIWPILGAAEGDDAAAGGDGDDAAGDDEGEDPPADDLGEAGKQALERMKADRDKARAELRELKAAGGDPKAVAALKASIQSASRRELTDLRDKVAALTAKEQGRSEEYEQQRKADAAAQEKVNQRIVRAEVKSAAAGKLADPGDAANFLDLTKFEVDDDGNVDEDEIAEAIDDLIKKKPYLAVQDGKRFKGSADGGARKGSAKSLDDQIAEATKAGNHLLAIQLKQQRAAEAKTT